MTISKQERDLIGKKVDRYLVDELVARHPASILYRATDPGSDETVFLEILNASADEEPELDGRFRRRMETLAQVQHPHIAAVLEVGRTKSNRSYAIVEHVPGESMAAKLIAWSQPENALPVTDALRLVQQLARGLAKAHAVGLIHYDLRPQHVVIRPDDTPALLNLGLPLEQPTPTPEEELRQLRMLGYDAPENWQGKALSARSNIFSLGIILYELLAGHRPQLPTSEWDIFQRATLPKETPLVEARPGLSSATYQVVQNCLWRQEWSRYETAADLANAIDDAIAAEQAEPTALRLPAALPRWLIVAVPLALLAIIAAVFLLRRDDTPPPPSPTVTAVPAIVEPTAAGAGNPTVAPTDTIPPTETAVPSATPIPPTLPPLSLLTPLPGGDFISSESIIFAWSWPEDLTPEQSFVVLAGQNGEFVTIGTVTEPTNENQYRLQIPITQAAAGDGVNDWQVILQDDDDVVTRSEIRTFVLLPDTPTPTATNTPLVTNTPTATRFVCAVSPPPGWVSYDIRAEDTLYNLALITGTTADRLQRVNCLTSTTLSVGQSIYLPQFPATDTPTPSPVPPTQPPPPPSDPGPKATSTAPPPPP